MPFISPRALSLPCSGRDRWSWRSRDVVLPVLVQESRLAFSSDVTAVTATQFFKLVPGTRPVEISAA